MVFASYNRVLLYCQPRITKKVLQLMKTKFATALLIAAGTYFFSGSCGKGGDNPPGGGGGDPCAGVTITPQATTTDAAPGQSNGSITITNPTGSGITYSINGTTFVATTTFSNLAAGSYVVTVKNAAGCSGSRQFTIATDACAGKTITVSGTNIINATPCATGPDGSLTVNATGSTGFTFNINNGTFQAGATFNNLAAGPYTVGAKDVDGCVKTASVTVGAKPAGPLFLAVKGVVQTSCTGCHSGGSPAGGIDFTVDCNIVARWDRIKARAVDGIPSFMPPPPNPQLSAADKQKITDWITAGHRYTD
jgi:hypothetical protein